MSKTPLRVRHSSPQDLDPALLSSLQASKFIFIEPAIVSHIVTERGFVVGVVSGEDGQYEWFIWSEKHLRTSNLGYGSPIPALRDALCEVWA